MSLWNWNTKLALLLCLVSGVADSIWIDTVLSSFLYGLARGMGEEKDENTLVGWGEAAWGVSQLIFALPIGFLADKWSKAKTIRLGSLLMFVAILITVEAIEQGSQSEDPSLDPDESRERARHSYWMLIGSMIAWGICGGITGGPAQALYADALPERLRTEGYTILFGVYLVASSTGPLITIFMFNKLSDKYEDWNLREIRPVFLAGVLLEIVVCVIMLFFKDIKPVDEEGSDTPYLLDGTTTADGSQNEQEEEKAPQEYNRKIPLILFFSSLVTALGSGASVKFFPLFFKDAGLKPEEVQWIFVLSPLCLAAFTVLAKIAANKIGRIKASLLLESSGSLLLMLMSFLHYQNINNPYVMIPVYLLRTSLINCTYALMESILMSSVPSNERSRWKSLESVAAFSWTGSAVVGGVLSDARGYAFAFMITAVLQLVGTWMLYPLDGIVPEEEEFENNQNNNKKKTKQQTTTGGNHNDDDDEDVDVASRRVVIVNSNGNISSVVMNANGTTAATTTNDGENNSLIQPLLASKTI